MIQISVRVHDSNLNSPSRQARSAAVQPAQVVASQPSEGYEGEIHI